MPTLFDYGPSQNAWKVRELLRRLGVIYERVEVAIFDGAARTPDFLARNPSGQVPAMAWEDGTVCGESNAILLLLAEGTRYLPVHRPARARVLQWLFFEQNALEPNVGALRHWRLTGKRRDPAVIAAREASARAALRVLDRGLAGQDFAGGDFSIADIALYAYGHAAADAGIALADFPNVIAWAARVYAHEEPLCPVIPYTADRASSRELP